MRTLFFFLLVIFCCGTLQAESWIVIKTSTTNNLHAVSVGNGKVAYAAGEKATLLKSIDGGVTWTGVAGVGNGNSFFGVGAYDTVFAIAAGANNFMNYKYPLSQKWLTGPAGVDTLFTLSNNMLQFDTAYSDAQNESHTIDTKTCFAAGSNGTMYQIQLIHHVKVQLSGPLPGYDTTYVSINQVVTSTTASLRGMVLEAAYYAVGDGGTILISLTNGFSWVDNSLNVPVNLHAIAAIPSGHLITVGDSGNIWGSADFGSTWNNISPAGLTQNLYGVSFADANTGVIVGENGLILKSTDGGNNWNRDASNNFSTLRGVYCYHGSDAPQWVAAGDSGTIVQTLFGGATAAYTLNHDSINFGDVPVNTKKSDTLKFTNTSSDAYLTLRVIASNPLVKLSATRMIIDPQTSGSIIVTYAPTDSGTTSFSLMIDDDADFIPLNIFVAGRGATPIATLSSQTIVFDSGSVGRNDTMMLRNTGFGTLAFYSLVLSDSSDFKASFLGPTQIQAGDTTYLLVQQIRSLPTDVHGTLIIKSNSIGGNDTVFLTAKDLNAVREQSMAPTEFFVTSYPNPSTAQSNLFLHTSVQLPDGAVIQVLREDGALISEIKSQKNNSGDIPIATSSLPHGNYFFKVMSGGGTILGAGKFVRE